MVDTRTLDIANAFQHADTLAARHDPAAHLYLDLAEALICSPAKVVEAAREAAIQWEIEQYRTIQPRGGI